MKTHLIPNNSTKNILLNTLLAFVSLFINGLGVYLTIRANIGSAPWDVLNLGLSKTFGILYGNASIAVSVLILLIDLIMREPIGIAMVVDAVTVGKAVDFFNYIDVVPQPKSLPGSILMAFIGMVILAYTQYYYMRSALSCGPRDTLLVGLAKRLHKLPIGIIAVLIQSTVTFTGWLLGGPVGIGTLLCAFCQGPIMQTVFRLVHFEATEIEHQSFADSFKVFTQDNNRRKNRT